MTQPEPVDAVILDAAGEEIEQPPEAGTTAALVAVPVASPLTRPVATYDEALVAFAEYERLRQAIIQPSDLQRAGAKEFVTKSGWRKMAVVMGVSSELRSRDYDRDEDGKIVRAEVIVRAIAPNGRFMDGLGVCDVYERCDAVCTMGPRDAKVPCTGFRHFSKPQHDIPATAYTRALNRACSDLFGFGEVSYEEVQGETGTPPAEGFETHAEARATYDEIIEAARTLDGYKGAKQGGHVPGSNAEAFANFHRASGFKIPYTRAEATAIEDELLRLGAQLSGPAAAAGASPTDASIPAEPIVESSGSGEGSGQGERVGTRDASTAPPETSAADVPVTSVPGDDAAVTEPSSAPTPATAPGAEAAPKPSTSAQRQRIAIRCNELAAKELLKQGDKKEVVAILTGERTETTTEMSSDEANRMISTLAFLESGDLVMADDPDDETGARTLGALTQRGQDFLAPIVKSFQPMPT